MVGLLACAGCGEGRLATESEPVGSVAQALGNGPDLVISAVSGPPAVMDWGSFDAAVTICNQGDDPAGGSFGVLLSTDDMITDADMLIATFDVGVLDPERCAQRAVPASASAPPGVHWLGAIADIYQQTDESDEDNNAAAGNAMGVGYGPDLTVRAVRGPASALPGGYFDASVSICNQGTMDSSGSDVDLVLSADAIIDGSDIPIAGASLGYLSPGVCDEVTVPGGAFMPDGEYYLGAIIDPYSSVVELREDNNAAAGDVIGIGYGPDLVVSAVSGPPNAMPGASFSPAITVCNQGTTPSFGADLTVVLSTDPIIEASDPSVGPGWFNGLSPGQCADVSAPAGAYVPDGEYHLGVIVDSYDSVPELIESNNGKAGGAIGVGFGPDLVVSAVTAPSSAAPNAPFMTEITVCNQGSMWSPGAEARVVLSIDATVTSADHLIGFWWSNGLSPGQCAGGSVPVFASVPDGAYWLGVILDSSDMVAELLEGNNAGVGGAIGVGYAPDYVISAVSGPPSVAPGNNFTATVTVCNQGTAPGFWSNVQLMLSTNATLSLSDQQIGGAPLGSLDVGECTDVEANLNAWAPDGAYYLGAIVDAWDDTDELIEDNNDRLGQRMGVGFGPDLIVSSVSGPPSSTPGASFTAAVTVCNQGTTPSSWAGVQVLLSSDSIITATDAFVGTVAVNSLDPGDCAAVSVPGYVNAPDGAYYLGAIADAWSNVPELIEDNNAKAGDAVGIGWGPDLVVSEVSGPPSVVPGASFSSAVTVCNQGTTPSSWSDVHVVLSTDATITVSDTMIGPAPVGSLDPGDCDEVTVPGAAYVPEGGYFLGAIVDPFNGVIELIEGNNAGAGGTMGVGSRPDFIIASVSGPPSAAPGGVISATVTVCNEGTTPTYGSGVHLFLSTDSTITTADSPLGMAPVYSLDPGECGDVTAQVSVYGPDGAYYLGAIADPWDNTPELFENNNAASGNLMGVGYAPDLVVSAVSGSPSATPGGPYHASVTVCNQGTTSSPGAPVEVFLSSDTLIGPSDYFIGSAPVNNLNPGECAVVSVDGYASPPGTAYHVGAIVDRWNYVFELIESNNATAGHAVGIGYGPDLIVSEVSGPPSAVAGGSFSVTATLCNQGTEPSPGTEVEAVLSIDSTITTADAMVASGWVGSLDPGQCAAVTMNGGAWVPDGAYDLGVIVDPSGYVPELLEANNAAAGHPVGIGIGPDYVVSAVSGPPSATPGSTFFTAVTVCNQGTSMGPWVDVMVVLSTDSFITSSDPFIGGAPVDSLEPGQCRTVSVSTAAYPPSDGGYFLGAIADPWNNALELFEENNARAGSAIGVGWGPDLVVSSVSGPPSVTPGASFSTTVNVCNQGTAQTFGSDVEVRASTDGTITAADMLIGAAPVNGLNPGDCVDVAVLGSAFPPSGAYVLGAIADQWNGVFELIEGNNTKAGSTLGVGYGPDLVVAAVSGPPSVNAWSNLSTDVTVCNQGTEPGYSAEIQVVLSVDPTITKADSHAGNGWVSDLDPGECDTVTVFGNANVSPGAYHIGAIVDPLGYVFELIEGNNTTAGGAVGVGSGPDYVISAVSGPPSAVSGGYFGTDVTVCNQGTMPGGWVDVKVVLSGDSTISAADATVGFAPVGGLNPDDCTTVMVNGAAWLPAGDYFLGAVVDPYESSFELIEWNNAGIGGNLTLGF